MLSQISIIFSISRLLGVRTEALRATVLNPARESVPTGEAFHLFLAAPSDLILGIVTQKKVGDDRIGNIHRIEPAFRAFV